MSTGTARAADSLGAVLPEGATNGHGPARRVTLSAVVAATDRPPTLSRVQESLRSMPDGPDEVLVIDSPGSLSPAAARNLGAADARGDVLVFVDSDVVPHGDAFRRIRAKLEADPGLAGVFGSYDSQPEADGLISTFRNLIPHHVHNSSPGPSTSFWAGLGAIRREAYLAVGGFDAERYCGPQVEDIELGMRLAEAGRRIELDPAIQGTHLKHWRFTHMLRTDLLSRGVPWVALLLQHRRLPRELNLAHRHRLSALAAVAAVAGVAGRRPALAVAAVVAQAALNLRLYGLFRRRMGNRGMLAGVALHSLHHLTGVLSLAVGALAYTREHFDRAAVAEPAPLVESLSAASAPEASRAVAASPPAASS